VESHTAQVLAVGTATVQVRKQWPQLVEVQRSSREAQVRATHYSAPRRARAFRCALTIRLLTHSPFDCRRWRQALMEQRRSELAQTKDSIKVCARRPVSSHASVEGDPRVCKSQTTIAPVVLCGGDRWRLGEGVSGIERGYPCTKKKG